VKCSCPNCDWSGDTSELDPVGIEVFQRIEPGDTFPNGECPECEALVSIAEPLRDAAPDLLAACETVVNDCNSILNGNDMSGMSDQELFSAIKQTLTTAIAKAKGGAL
jgi:hypothetical protein